MELLCGWETLVCPMVGARGRGTSRTAAIGHGDVALPAQWKTWDMGTWHCRHNGSHGAGGVCTHPGSLHCCTAGLRPGTRCEGTKSFELSVLSPAPHVGDTPLVHHSPTHHSLHPSKMMSPGDSVTRSPDSLVCRQSHCSGGTQALRCSRSPCQDTGMWGGTWYIPTASPSIPQHPIDSLQYPQNIPLRCPYCVPTAPLQHPAIVHAVSPQCSCSTPPVLSPQCPHSIPAASPAPSAAFGHLSPVPTMDTWFFLSPPFPQRVQSPPGCPPDPPPCAPLA